MDKALIRKTGHYIIDRGDFSVSDMQHYLGLSFKEVYETTEFFINRGMIKHVGGRLYSRRFDEALLERYIRVEFGRNAEEDIEAEYEKRVNMFIDGVLDGDPDFDGFDEELYDEKDLRDMFGDDLSSDVMPEEECGVCDRMRGESYGKAYDDMRKILEYLTECFQEWHGVDECLKLKDIRDEFDKIVDAGGLAEFMKKHGEYISELVRREGQGGGE